MVCETLTRPRGPKIKAIKAGGTNTGPRRGVGGTAEAFLSNFPFLQQFLLSLRGLQSHCAVRGVVVRWSRPPRLERSSLFWQPLTFALHQVEPRTLVVENLTGGTGRPHKVLTMAGSRYVIARQMNLWNYLKHATECSFQAQSGQRQGLGWPAYPIWQQVCAHCCSGQGLDQWHSPCLSYHGW